MRVGAATDSKDSRSGVCAPATDNESKAANKEIGVGVWMVSSIGEGIKICQKFVQRQRL